MTRFIMSLDEAIDLVLYAFEHGRSGDIFVQKAPACTIQTQAEAVCEIFGGKKEDIKVIGIRHGEKLYETLLTNEECAKAIDEGNFYRVPADNRTLNYDKFFTEGDESELRPMILKDIADKTGLDISTISRVSNVKYVQTRWGTFPLRFFFTESYTTESGEELSTRKIKLALKDIIDSEDKHHPYSDERLTQMMKEKGMTVARRTVAKYREQLGIPVARLRKE
jgi:hypothetical protein